MAITSEIIGKLGGGAGVDIIDVSAPSKTGSTELAHIDVPPGKEILVTVRGTIGPMYDSPYVSLIQAGGATIGGELLRTGVVTGATTLTTSTSISIRVEGFNAKSFTGTIYTAEM